MATTATAECIGGANKYSTSVVRILMHCQNTPEKQQHERDRKRGFSDALEQFVSGDASWLWQMSVKTVLLPEVPV